jgi:glyoxylase-like metal-dependent hydrolase (beta-lactamase superfamily II)
LGAGLLAPTGRPVKETTLNHNSTCSCSLRIFAAAIGFIVACAGMPAARAGGHTESPVTAINAAAVTANIDTLPLRGGISVLMGSGGNITVLNSADGKLMVDGGIAVSRPRLAAALDQISAAPIKHLINTHWHWDHTDGNKWLQETGATLSAHENTLKHLSNTVRVEDWLYTFQPLPVSARPTMIIKTEKTMSFGGDIVVIRYYGPAHTDGDLSVYFTKADVLATGDTWWNGMYPFIDYVAGGSIDGMIRAANANIARGTEETLIVPGHGPVGGRAQLTSYRDMLVNIRENVAKLKQQGKTLDEIIAAKPTADYDAKWGQYVIDPAFFTRLVYKGV